MPNMLSRREERIVFIVGLIVTLACGAAALASSDTTHRRVFDNLHWTLGYLTGAVLATMAARRAPTTNKPSLRLLALGMALFLIGQLAWDIQVWVNWNPFPGPSDAFFLCLGPFAFAAFWKEQVSKKGEWRDVFIDVALLTLTSIVLVLALYLPIIGETQALAFSVTVAYPVFLFAAFACFIQFTLRTTPKMTPAIWAMGGAIFGMALLWLEWNRRTLAGTLVDGDIYNIGFSVVAIAYGVAATGWRPTTSTNPIAISRFRGVLLNLPMAATLLTAVAIVWTFSREPNSEQTRAIILGGGVASALFALARQSLFARELQLSEERYALAESGSSSGLWDWNIERGEAHYSDRYLELIGWPQNAFGTDPNHFFEIIHPEDQSMVSRALDDHFDKGEPYEATFRMRSQDGMYRWFHSRGSAQFGPAGKPIRMSGSIQDVSDQVEAQLEARREQEFSNALMSSAGHAIIATREDGVVIAFNPAAEAMFGYSADEVVGKMNAAELQDPEDAKKLFEEVGTLRDRLAKLDCDESFQRETIMRRKDGSTFPSLSSYAPLIGPDGAVVGVVSYRVDISEMKARDAALRDSQEMFANVYRLTPASISIIRVSDGKVIDVNPAFESLCGFSVEEARGKTALELGIYRSEDDRRPVFEAFQRDPNHAPVEQWFYNSRGEHRVALMTIRAIRVAGEDCYLIVSNDITEQRDAVMALLESENRFRQIVDNSPMGIMLCELNEQSQLFVTGVNPAGRRIIGEGRTEDMVGKSIEDALPRLTDLGVTKALYAAATIGTMYVDEHFVVESQDTFRCFELYVFQAGEGRVAAMFLDVSDRVRIEREIQALNQELESRVEDRTSELVAANMELESFAYSVSHDLRTPLRGIDGFAHLLESSPNIIPLAEELQYCQRIRVATARMSEIIDSILVLSRVTRKEFTGEDVDLSKIVNEVCEEIGSHLGDRRIEWRIEPSMRAFGDARLLKTLMENLVGNSAKYSSRSDPAVIEVFQVHDGADLPTFCVQDNGVGFDMAYADKLFVPFQRLHRVDEFEGAGIGLATSARIVARHGGTIWAQGEVGVGAKVFFTLGRKPVKS